ncbi:DUF1294 domain-containing protein [Metapseudomonas boanensis]|uniref:DUF1294 domain-containing protein n=1 Tax=Metapseudomonas boanensis TaxID=2822138 RepID=UPI003A70476B
MSPMRKAVLAAGAWYFSEALRAEVYRCVQPDGVVQFSDRGCASLQASQPLASESQSLAAYFVQLMGQGPEQLLGPWLSGFGAVQLLLLAYALMSLLCFVAYWRDKRFAIAGQQRTPETRLHLLELLGGWPGGLLAQRLIRHKNRKLSYQFKFWLIVAVHLSVLGYWLFG